MNFKNSEAMRKNVFILAAAALLFAGCAKEVAEQFETASYNTSISAVIDGVDTKAALADDGTFTWQEGDKIAVYTSAKAFKTFTLTDGAGTNKAHFGGNLSDGETVTGPAVYPVILAPEYVSATEVKVTLPETYTYEGAQTNVPMTGTLSNSVLAFKQVGGVVKFSVTGIPDDATKLVVTAKAASLTGTYNTKNSAAIVAKEAESSTVTINFTKTGDAMDFFLPVPTGTFKNVAVSLRKANDAVISEKTATADNAIDRGTLLKMPAISLSGEGSIATADELIALLTQLDKTLSKDTYEAAIASTEGKTWQLVADIDLAGKTVPVAEGFKGTIDGNGHALKNWTNNGKPLFANNAGAIKNLVFDKSCVLTIPSTLTNFGVLASLNTGNITAVVNNADITGTDITIGGGRLGGIIGFANADGLGRGIVVKDVVNNGKITLTTEANTGGTQYVGGVIGSIGNSTENILKNCENNGDITVTCTGTNTKNFYFGGVAGGSTNGSGNVQLKNTGNVTFTCEGHEAALCLAGVSSYTTGVLTNCENTGKITYASKGSLKATFVAGIAGYFASNTMSGCVNKGDVSVTAVRINGRNGIGDINSKVYNGTNAIVAGLTAGGLVSATGKDPVFENSENYGKVSVELTAPANTDGTHTAARPSVGGLVGDCAGPMTNCNNHGDVSVKLGNGTSFKAKNAGYTFYVGGIVGSGYNFSGATTSGGKDTNKLNKFTLTNCNNSGNVSYVSYNDHTTNNAVGGICAWPGSEDSTTPYIATNCHNTGNITVEGEKIKIRTGGVHGGTGRMNGCSNSGKITVVNTLAVGSDGKLGSVAGSVAGFQSQAHTFSNCFAGGTVESKCTIAAMGGLVANLGNVEFSGMDGCAANCTLIGGPDGNSGLIVGKFNGTDKAITLGTEESMIQIAGSVNGTKVTTENVATYFCGQTGFNPENHTVYYVFDGKCYKNADQISGFVENLAEKKFTYAGRTYPLVKLADGKWWMAAPLAYVPAGKTVSADPTADAGIWYTYTVLGKNKVEPNVTRTDAYLYDYATAFGLNSPEDITYGTQSEWQTGNYRSFEGTQGICPPGWYIPTRADFLKLVGASNADQTQGETKAIDDPTAVYYEPITSGGSTVKRFNAEGWNFSFMGCRSKASTTQAGSYNAAAPIDDTKCSEPSWYGLPGLSQIMTSTPYRPNVTGTNVQFFCLMTTFTSTYKEGRLSLSYGNYLHGMEVRCVRKATE